MPEPHEHAVDLVFEAINVGDEAAFHRVIGEDELQAFARLTGDWNPLHMDAGYASGSRFGERVVHGMLVASFFSTLVGMYLPGRRALFLSQQVKFAHPVKVGEGLTFRGRVRHKTESVRIIDVDTEAISDSGEVKVRGTVQVMVLP